MCGFAGVVALSSQLDVSSIKRMADVIAHRGPDDAGYLLWQSGRKHPDGKSHGRAFTDCEFQSLSPTLPTIDSTAGRELLHQDQWDLFLAHRRLSIIDITPKAHQPMSDSSGQVWLSYNGEVYNFRELRVELENEGHQFLSSSDTEVLLKAYLQWGVEFINRLNGMFAFAIWDGRRQELILGRDRYGIKPLYYLQANGLFLFGSEIKSLLQYPSVKPGVDLLALNEYFSFQNTFSDRTLFDGVRVLPPGTLMVLHPRSGKVERRRYWDFDVNAESDASVDDIVDELAERIHQAIIRQCVADVPIGSYLSGGMDSGTVTYVASKHLGRISTFTAGFDLSDAAEHEMWFDEREPAERMASVFQTEHYEVVLHAGDIQPVMSKLIWHLEDLRVGQCYPNYYIARLASRFVKVVLSGTGGDELFGGYPWRYAAAIGEDHDNYVQNYYRYWKRLVANRDKPDLYQPDVAAALRQMNDDGAVPFHDHTVSVFRRVFGRDVKTVDMWDQVRQSLYFECKTFLHGLLTVEDKLSMAHSLETRVPLLDNEIVDFALRIPVDLKIGPDSQLERFDENDPGKKRRKFSRQVQPGKSILRQAMFKSLPTEVTQARKQGFSAPDESWFRGRCEEYVRDTLLDPQARINEFLNPAFVAKTLEEHSSQQHNRRLLIWSLLSFEYWLRHFQA